VESIPVGVPRKTLLVIDGAFIGGGQKHVLALAARLSRPGLEVAVACEANGYLVDHLRQGGIPHHVVRLSTKPSPRALAETVDAIRASHAELVHTHGGTAGLYGRLAARWVGGVRTVHTYHGIHYLHDQRPAKRLVRRAIDRFLLRWTDEVICVAHNDKELALGEKLALPDHVSVIHNGIDIAGFDTRRTGEERLAQRNGEFIVGTVGRLHEQKGHIFLLQAAALIRQAHPQVRFRIIGDGPLRPALEARARELGVGEAVEFLGARDDIAEQMRDFDVFVLPSLWEGLPYVLLEAMAAGLPIVTTDFRGVREVISDGSEAIVVPTRNAEALADAIAELMRDRALWVERGAKGAQVVRERFSLDAMVEQTLKVYARAMRV
jgi:glycosyltransferase involved in cell wall biosynthesis